MTPRGKFDPDADLVTISARSELASGKVRVQEGAGWTDTLCLNARTTCA